jgi:hypothetical protein
MKGRKYLKVHWPTRKVDLENVKTGDNEMNAGCKGKGINERPKMNTTENIKFNVRKMFYLLLCLYILTENEK